MRSGSYPRKLKLLERFQISECLNGQTLSCGCLVGRYLTRAGHVLTVVDSDADGCPERTHQVDFVLSDAAPDIVGQPVH
jgi:hypothetical protein